jgi:hypothetical protein
MKNGPVDWIQQTVEENYRDKGQAARHVQNEFIFARHP